MDNMIPSISMIPPSAREAAKETTEEVMKALDSKMRAFQSLYSQVSCSDMSAMNRISDVCAPLSGGNGGGATTPAGSIGGRTPSDPAAT